MSDLDRTWDEDNNNAMPPTPGRTLNILPSNQAATANRENDSNKAKRRLDLEANPVFPEKKLKPFTIPKKSKPKEDRVQQPQQQPLPKKPKIEQQPPPPLVGGKVKAEQRSSPPTEDSKKLKPAEELRLAKRLKTQVWAKILRQKQKLYIPHASDPRGQENGAEETTVPEEEFDVKPSISNTNKENTSIMVNVIATVMTTPVKMTDHNSIIKLMSITPQLLSPLSENPRIFK